MRNRISQEAMLAAKAVYMRLFDQSHASALRLKDAVYRLAKEYEQINSRPPKPDDLWRELHDRLETDGRVRFMFNKAALGKKSYSDIYESLSGEMISDIHINRHRRVGGDIAETEYLLHSERSQNPQLLAKKFLHHLENYQIRHAERIMAYVLKELRGEDLNLFYSIASAKIQDTKPLAFLQNYPQTKVNKQIKIQHEKFALESGLSIEHVFGICGCFPANKIPYKIDTFLDIREFLSYEIEDIADLNARAAAMAMVFPDYNDFIKYCERWPSYHDGSLKLQNNADIDIWSRFPDYSHLPVWGEALLQYGPQIIYYFESLSENVDFPRNKDNVLSLKLLKEEIYAQILDQENIEPRYEKLHRFCFDHQLSLSDHFFRASYLIENYSQQKRESDFIPPVDIDGSKFGLAGYRFRLLEDDDYRVLFLGRFTNCCESLARYCQNSVIHSYKTRESGFYVLTNADDRIVAHSWAWRSDDNILVLDGFEAKETERKVTDAVLRNILNSLSEELSGPGFADFNIPALAVGLSGKGFAPHRGLREISIEASFKEQNWLSRDDYIYLRIEGEPLGFSNKFFLFRELEEAKMHPDLGFDA